jgi:hypothetical protein
LIDQSLIEPLRTQDRRDRADQGDDSHEPNEQPERPASEQGFGRPQSFLVGRIHWRIHWRIHGWTHRAVGFDRR